MSLVLNGVSKSFPDFRIEMDLRVASGELLTLLGPSGCGKTTTLRLIAGLIRPDRGRIMIAGRNVDNLSPDRREIGIVFQDYALFPHLNVYRNIAFGPRMRNWSSARTRARVRSLLRLVRLEEYEKRRVTSLSGGEQQRIALARAMAPEPGLLLMDEPISALDAALRKELRSEIRRIQKELEVTTLYVTHDQEEALAISDRIAVMRRGGIEQIGTPREIYERPANTFVARFIGRSNLIQGTLSEVKSQAFLVSTPAGNVESRPASDSAESALTTMGQNVILFFRPEDCLVQDIDARRPGGRDKRDQSTGREAAVNIFYGAVRHCEYLGEYTNLIVDVESLQITVKQTSDGLSYAPGQRVAVKIDPAKCLIFPEEVQDSD